MATDLGSFGWPLLIQVIIEGVGAARREETHLLDAVVWVQSDFGEAMRRALVRDGGDAPATELRDAWMAEEIPFLAADRPWERATIIVARTSDITHDPVGDVVIARGSGGDRGRPDRVGCH